MPKILLTITLGLLLSAFSPHTTPQNPSPPSTKPTEHLIGTITAVDPTAHAVTVKEDKSGNTTVILLADTRTLIKVAPGAKDLKNATRITADQLATGDRVDIRGSKSPADFSQVAARSVVLMSARDLQVAHQAEAEAWQKAIAGVVRAVDSASGKITITQRTAEGVKPLVLATSSQTQFLRYSPDAPNKPSASQLAQIQPGDQIKAIGQRSVDGAEINTQKIYSGAFRTVNGAVLSISPDGKQLTIKDLATRKPLDILLNESSSIHKLPPELAMSLARRLNSRGRQTPGAAPGGQTGANGQEPAADRTTAAVSGQPSDAHPESPGVGQGIPHTAHNGDISQMIENLPKIAITDLKPGDAVVVSGAAATENSPQLTATQVIAGVEPILQSAPARQGGEALGGDWGLGSSEMEAPQQ